MKSICSSHEVWEMKIWTSVWPSKWGCGSCSNNERSPSWRVDRCGDGRLERSSSSEELSPSFHWREKSLSCHWFVSPQKEKQFEREIWGVCSGGGHGNLNETWDGVWKMRQALMKLPDRTTPPGLPNGRVWTVFDITSHCLWLESRLIDIFKWFAWNLGERVSIIILLYVQYHKLLSVSVCKR